MTQNQIAYHNARELERHNLASEAETARHQQQDEAIKRRSNELSHESNIINKEHYERMDAINQTHYSNQDAYNSAMLAETQRANLANERIRAQQNAINAAAIGETARHQAAMEGIQSSLASNTIYKTQAEVSAMSPNADYTRAKTAQMWADWGLTNAKQMAQFYENDYIRPQRQADLQNTKARTGTEKTRQFLNVSTGVSNLSGMVQSWLKTLGVSMR